MNGEGAEAPEVAQEITETNIETNNNKNMAEFGCQLQCLVFNGRV